MSPPRFLQRVLTFFLRSESIDFRLSGYPVKIVGPTQARDLPGSIRPIPASGGRGWYHLVEVPEVTASESQS